MINFLYKLATDHTKTQNLAHFEPENLADLTSHWAAWYAALPMGGGVASAH